MDASCTGLRLSMLSTSTPATPSRRRADQQQVVRAERSGGERQQRRSGDAAQARAGADETEQALGLPRVVDLVGQRPELADQEDAHDQPEEVEPGRHHPVAGLEQEPEPDQQPGHRALGDRDDPPRRDDPGGAAVALHDHADGDGGDQRDVGDVVGAELGDELRARDRLEDVVRRHRQERVGEHHDERDAFLLADVDDRSEAGGGAGDPSGRMVPPARLPRPGSPAAGRRTAIDRPDAADAGCGLERARREARRGARGRPDVPLRRAGRRRVPARQAHSQRPVPRRVRRLQPRLRLRRGAAGAGRGAADLRPASPSGSGRGRSSPAR